MTSEAETLIDELQKLTGQQPTTVYVVALMASTITLELLSNTSDLNILHDALQVEIEMHRPSRGAIQ